MSSEKIKRREEKRPFYIKVTERKRECNNFSEFRSIGGNQLKWVVSLSYQCACEGIFILLYSNYWSCFWFRISFKPLMVSWLCSAIYQPFYKLFNAKFRPILMICKRIVHKKQFVWTQIVSPIVNKHQLLYSTLSIRLHTVKCFQVLLSNTNNWNQIIFCTQLNGFKYRKLFHPMMDP